MDYLIYMFVFFFYNSLCQDVYPRYSFSAAGGMSVDREVCTIYSDVY